VIHYCISGTASNILHRRLVKLKELWQSETMDTASFSFWHTVSSQTSGTIPESSKHFALHVTKN